MLIFLGVYYLVIGGSFNDYNFLNSCRRRRRLFCHNSAISYFNDIPYSWLWRTRHILNYHANALCVFCF